MSKLRASKTRKTRQSVWLYDFVFLNRSVKFATLCLLFVFVVLPASPVFAADEADAGAESNSQSTEVVEKVLVESQPDESEEIVTEDNEPDLSLELEADESEEVLTEDSESDLSAESEVDEYESIVTEAEADLEADEAPDTVKEKLLEELYAEAANSPKVTTQAKSTTTDNDTDSSSDTSSGTTTTTVTSSTTTPLDVVDSTTSDSVDNQSASTTSTESSATSTSEQPDDVAQPSDEFDLETEPTTDSGASTSTQLTEQTVTTSTSSTTGPDDTGTSTDVKHTQSKVVYAVDNSSAYEFQDGQCKAVGDGTFYCTDGSVLTEQVKDAVFAAPDRDGDLEIYIRLDGLETKVTDNKVDDSAPHYDSLSNRLVWHTLKNDRYQIVSYDMTTGETKQLTDTSYNNMQPTAFGNVTFWQAWIENNWEIVRYEDGSVIQMTENQVHDIAPFAQDGMVMWQTQNGDEWKISLYDLEEETHQYLNSETEGIAKNPRLVLMYESLDSNGDVHVLGYDLRSQKHIQLRTTPTPLPRDIPKPEHEEEKRALIQTKPTPKTNSESEDDDNIGNPLTSSTTEAVSPKTATSTVVIPKWPSSSSTSTPDVATSSDQSVLSVATSSATHIPDLVIQSYESEPSETEIK